MTFRNVRRAAFRLADQQAARLAELPSLRAVIATVATVTAGASPGGNALVTVIWRGVELTAAGYLASYTPAVGDRVECHLIDNQLIVVDTIAS